MSSNACDEFMPDAGACTACTGSQCKFPAMRWIDSTKADMLHCAGDVLPAPVRDGAAQPGAALRVLGQLLRALQRHPGLQHQHAGTIARITFLLGTCAPCRYYHKTCSALQARMCMRTHGACKGAHTHLLLWTLIPVACLRAAAQRLAVGHGGRVRVPVPVVAAVPRQAQHEGGGGDRGAAQL